MVSDAQRRSLYDKLVRSLGEQDADPLMEYLPPVGWNDVARRADLDALRAQMEGKFGVLEGTVRRLEGRLYAAMAAQTVVLVGLVKALT